ncbi:MAG: DUF3047 domain-containing protein [Leptospiraceae bacterium]|nr:DUF3047 domain-containing protein [Leptospiraceae bacterium]MCP5493491.1 DUF3047 domain-containing protein [Leptospiraceae bacterium]
MKKLFITIIFVIGSFSSPVCAKALYVINFNQPPSKNAIQWLKENGFELKKSATNLKPKFDKGGLVLESQDKEFGIILKKNLRINNAKKVRITWGVDLYPIGANWEKGNNREAISVMIFFGNEKISSGKVYAPDLPYFIGIFPGANEKEGKAYIAKTYKKGGRYFCSPCEKKKGQEFLTEFELEKNFQKLFNKNITPFVSAISIEVDTTDTEGKSRAYIKKIEFLQ